MGAAGRDFGTPKSRPAVTGMENTIKGAVCFYIRLTSSLEMIRGPVTAGQDRGSGHDLPPPSCKAFDVHYESSAGALLLVSVRSAN
jgi:hypothetical protein